ncbi:MAG: F0F1 ATP synthase subunit A [Thermodesulfobacteriota bacterium]|nr:F0F1 ATP synthase subunit A [Thermodesulfobacteriota bacterium]
MGHEFSWVSKLPFFDSLTSLVGGHEHDSLAIYHVFLVVAILTLVVIIAYARRSKDVIPDGKVSARNVAEVIVQAIMGLLNDVIGHEGKRFLPLIGTLAVFILFCNLMGLLPGFSPPTDNINTTAACALTVFFYYHYVGIRKHGWSYIKQFFGPFLPIAPLMFPIEIISHLARPLSLSLRLFGNMTGDHLVLVIFSALIPLLIPIIAMGLGIFVSVIQSLVFILLSMMYLSGALAEEH